MNVFMANSTDSDEMLHCVASPLDSHFFTFSSLWCRVLGHFQGPNNHNHPRFDSFIRIH